MKLDISFFIPGMPFNGETIYKESLGGSETAGYYMASSLAQRGHHITVFCNTDVESAKDGVCYIPAHRFVSYASNVPHDVAIVQRAPEVFSRRLNAKLNLLWCHDLALKRQEPQFKGALWNVDKVLLLSDFMVQQYKNVYGLTDEVICQTRNGVDLSLYQNSGHEKREKAVLYCARPERGMDNLLDIFPLILERHPDCQLWLAGYNNPAEQWQGFYADLERKAGMFGPSVKFLGHLTKIQLAEVMQKAMVYAYPTPSPQMTKFDEVSCISAMECQAAGLPIVTTHRGALPETIHPKACKTIDINPWDKGYKELFAESVCDYLEKESCWQKSHKAALEYAKTLDWEGVAEEWESRIHHWISERNSDNRRLALHLIKHDDIEAAKTLSRCYSMPDIEAKLKARAPTSQPLPDDIQQAMLGVQQCPRLRAYCAWLKQAKVTSVLDIACSWGGYTLAVSQRFPDVWFRGVDIDDHAIDIAKGLSKQSPNLSFSASAYGHRDYDGLVMMEVLEHLEKPWEFVDDNEAVCQPGTQVFITVPYGPWQDQNHLWAFDSHDIRDMFGGKKNLSVQALPFQEKSATGEPLGWWVVTYEASGIKTGKVDMARKLVHQAPRQTLSAMMLAGPGAEENIHWCLRSIKDVADEIIVVNTGMTDECKRIISQYPVSIIDGPNPLKCGFDAARNAGLAECKMDWVLWIDTDERLLDPENLNKYLRESYYHGFSIKQHHFSVDASWKPDMPVRLFRNRPYGGKEMKFYGVCHEHPELGLNEGPGPTIVISDVPIAHVGYLIESIRQKRFFRNYDLVQRDKAQYPERKLQKHFLMRDNVILAGYIMQQNGGQVTDQIRQLCEDTITLYQEHFLGKSSFVGVDSMHYYSHALKILGRGFDCYFDVGALPAGSGREDTLRFASKEDFVADLVQKAQASIGELQHEYW